MRLGYLVPEFPSQTHIFFWREIQALRDAGVDVFLLSTKKPDPLATRHDFARKAIAETHYLFSRSMTADLPRLVHGLTHLAGALDYARKLQGRDLRSWVERLGMFSAAVELMRWSSTIQATRSMNLPPHISLPSG